MSDNGAASSQNANPRVGPIPTDSVTSGYVMNTPAPVIAGRPPLAVRLPPRMIVPRPGPSYSNRPIEENRRRPIGPGNHEKAWNDPPMFSVDANTRSAPRGSRLSERVAFPLSGTPAGPSTSGYNTPSTSLGHGYIPPPPQASALQPVIPMAAEPRVVIPPPPPPPPGSGDSLTPVPIFYGNLPQPIIPPYAMALPPRTHNRHNISQD